MKLLIVLSILSLALLTAAAASPGETNSLQLRGKLVQ